MAPVGTLADFIEVSGEYEGVVDEFLREELNYVVVKSWVAAEAGRPAAQIRRGWPRHFLIHPAGVQGRLFEERRADQRAPA